MTQNTEESRAKATEAFLAMKLSEAIRMSVNECKAVEASSYDDGCVQPMERKYLDMTSWLYRLKSGECYLCMAGAVMQGIVPELKLGQMVDPTMLSSPLKDKLIALNKVRVGECIGAILRWGHSFSDSEMVWENIERWRLHNTHSVHRLAGAHLPWDSYIELADMLETHGM